MTASQILMSDTNRYFNVKGEPIRCDEWYGPSGGSFTVSIHTQNLKGRIYIEASLASKPKDHTDWFPIWLSLTTPYIEYPLNKGKPTGSVGLDGDTRVSAFSFDGNFTWIRAVLDRCYIHPNPSPTDYETIAGYGVVKKIILTR